MVFLKNTNEIYLENVYEYYFNKTIVIPYIL